MFHFICILSLIASPAFAKEKSEYIVKFRQANANQLQGFGEKVEARAFQTDARYFTLIIDSSVETKTLNKIKKLPQVEYVEKNGLVQANLQPNDPEFANQYALKNIGQADRKGQLGIAGMDINVLPVWEMGITGRKEILVAVVDTGIDFTHPDLVRNIFINQKEVANGKDDDGNGFVDDLQGWNFREKNNRPLDGFGHGSHVAGIIGANGNDGIGMSGVAWNVTLLPIRALDNKGNGKVSHTVEAINYARKMKANIINLSLGTLDNSLAFKEAIENAGKEGILVLISAGNEGNDNDKKPYYPSSFALENTLTVAALDNRGTLIDWSNFGVKTVQLAAPGVWIYSAVHNGNYIYAAGTSMAAPHVAGAAALLMSAHAEWDYREIIRRLLLSCEPNATLQNKVTCGGHLNILRALTL
jgi:subtilisin family serine protease